MNAYILSDQHMEFRRLQEEEFLKRSAPQCAEIAIIAGDFDIIDSETSLWLDKIVSKVSMTLYVPGNHDYYGSNWQAVDNLLASIEVSFKGRFKVLRAGEVFEYGGRRFLGDTMWFPNTPNVWVAQNWINDPHQIKGFFPEVFHRYDRFVAFLRDQLQPEDIVVTHHLPSLRSTPLEFKNSPTNAYFLADMEVESLIFERNPKIWIHGHTHQRCEYMLGETRVICNPAGYPSDRRDYRPFQFTI